MKRLHQLFAALGVIALAATSAALGAPPRSAAPAADALPAPETVAPFALARLLAEAPPDVVVVTLDDAAHALRGALPVAFFGADDAAFAAQAPARRAIVLAARDVVRADRVARALALRHVRVRVLEGGLDAWDAAMSADPAPPAADAGDAAWRRYRGEVALRRAFGEAARAPAVVPVAAPVAPAAAPGAAVKKREGC